MGKYKKYDGSKSEAILDCANGVNFYYQDFVDGDFKAMEHQEFIGKLGKLIANNNLYVESKEEENES